jgi:glucokinase
MFLAGDIGGTKTLIAAFDGKEDGLTVVREQEFHSAQYASLAEIVCEFIRSAPHLDLSAACFGVAGMVVDGRCQTTNLPWEVDASKLAEAARLPKVKLLNDLEATALGVLQLKPSEFERLSENAQAAPGGNIAVIAAGTGLGEALLCWDGHDYRALASEGGHADFAPRTEIETELLRYLRNMFPEHVSYERVLSGPGIHNIYCFLRDRGYGSEPQWLAQSLKHSADPSALISETALAGKDELCRRTLELFATLYGAEAGNLALRCLATGGVYIGGGIGPKIKAVLANGSFMRGFLAKGRLSEFLKGVPVFLSLNPRAALLGAAHHAARL